MPPTARRSAAVLPANTASVAVPVRAAAPGSGGNVRAGSIAVITTPVPGVDTATNAAAFINGVDAESDPAFRTRFVLYLASLSRATKAAVSYAVTSVQQGVVCTITENQECRDRRRWHSTSWTTGRDTHRTPCSPTPPTPSRRSGRWARATASTPPSS
ncbi:MAG: baseplate J/gp47 family protein [Isosphaeraceae bacterium]